MDLPIKSLSVNDGIDRGNAPMRAAFDNKVYQTSDFYDIGRGVVPRLVMRSMARLAKIEDSLIVPLSIGDRAVGSLLCVKPRTKDYSYELPVIKAFANHLAIIYTQKQGGSLSGEVVSSDESFVKNYAEIVSWVEDQKI